MKLFRRFDYLPTVDSYFLQRSPTGILCSRGSVLSSLVSILTLLCVAFYNVAVSVSSNVCAIE